MLHTKLCFFINSATGNATLRRAALRGNILLLLFLLSATFNLKAQDKPVTLSVKNEPIKTVLAQIEQQSGYRILYNDEVVPDEMRVSVDVENKTVKEVLQTLLKETELTFVMQSDELIIITKREYTDENSEVFGTVTDENGQSVPYANIVLLDAVDTTRMNYGAVTDERGYYKLADVSPGSYRLQVSFIGYKTQYSEFVVEQDNRQPIVRNFTLPVDQTVLQELVVEGQRPALRAEEGKLIYYIPTLLKNKPVTNAYEALKEIPGVMEQSDVLHLIGTSGSTVLINGQKRNMTTEQLMNLLRTIPLSRIEDVEIMYSVPPQYNIRGAAINVVLKQTVDEELLNTWQGELAGEFRQRTYSGGNGRGNLLYMGKRTVIEALYSYNNGKSKTREDMTAEHRLDDKLYHIIQKNERSGKGQSHNLRLSLNHTLKNKDKLDVSYLGNWQESNSASPSVTTIDNKNTNTKMNVDGPSRLHNIKADYAFHFGLKAGAEHTYFSDKNDYQLISTPEDAEMETDRIKSASRQEINRSFFYANQTHQLKNNWTINYGGNYSLTNTQNFSDAVRNDTVYRLASFDNAQREDIWNLFASVGKSFSEKLSMQASLAVEHYAANETSDGKTTQLWNNWAFFPTLNASYTHSPDHIFQFALSSDKSYPAYWTLNPTVYHFNAYGVTYGNPHLRPMRIYDLGLTYIYKQKYVIRPYFNHIYDYYTQMPYQSRQELKQEFMEQNFDYRQQIGLLAVVPFNIGKRISSQFIANGLYWREKDDTFFDIPFDRKTFFALFQLNSDIELSTRPDLRLNISGYYSLPTAIQGIYDLSATGDLSTGLTWTFDKKRAKLILKASDVFNTNTPSASVNFKGQKSTLEGFRDTRSVSISFVYRFGGFKEKERKEVDTSRFGTQ